jgi:hypothetical protein
VIARSLRGAIGALLLLAVGAAEAAAWGDLGHQAIGRAAQQLLDEETKAAIARAAGLAALRDDELARMGTWPDDVRRLLAGTPRPIDAAEAQAFVARFPDHAAWHYVNLPLGSEYPAGAGAYTRPNDVVHSLLRCLAVLEGREAAPGLTTPTALRFLVHLVGDVHQPLHVAAGYFDLRDPSAPRLVTGPVGARAALNDLGGNRLFFAATSLHATWDHGIVQALGGGAVALAAELGKEATQMAPPAGDTRGWPRQWASESSRIAAEVAYRPLRFGAAGLKSADEIERVEIAAPGYDEYVRDPGVRAAARRQLARAALRLAELLRRVRWR